MKRIRLTIDTQEPAYGRQLAKGLAMTGKCLFITLAEYLDSSDHWDHEELRHELENWEEDVYLTDKVHMAEKIGKKAILLERGRGMGAEKEKKSVALDADERKSEYASSGGYYRLDYMAALHEIYQMIVEVYQIEQGCFLSSMQERCSLYGFLPATGGSGATAAAVTFGRILAGSGGKRVLYIQQGDRTEGEQESFVYFEGGKKQLRPTKELEYLLQADKRFCVENYMAEDRYGLFYLNIRNNIKQLLQYLEKYCMFSDIILDGCEWDKKVVLNKAFYVLNGQDRRTDRLLSGMQKEIEQDSDKVILLNHCSSFFKKEKNLFWIPKDEESFRCEENRVEISMHMAFARAMRAVVKEAVQ